LNPKPDWRTSTWRRAQISAIAGVGYPLVNLLGRTLRWQVDGAEHLDALTASGRPPVLGFWHGRILPATYYFRRRGIVVITSENFDGEWIARIIERFGYGTARGSTSRGARRALLQMKRVLETGRAVAFTLDGPRGPARRAQAGAVWLAGATENPLVPFHIEAERHWTLGSWDRTQIPRPFSTTALAIGVPIPVPRDPDDAMIERKREELEHALGLLEVRAKQMLKK
jgi:lysophospholipid acyltransferase (LPLAT)-like uncharacterized protein